jgi:hypothetical protein
VRLLFLTYRSSNFHSGWENIKAPQGAFLLAKYLYEKTSSSIWGQLDVWIRVTHTIY